VEKPEGNRTLENLAVGGRIILRWMLEKQDGVIGALVITVMNLRVP
jgi:hypothetical protein